MNQKIIIAEDEVKIAQLLADYLEQNGFKPVQVHDGADVLQTVYEKNAAALLLDVMLPNKGGVSILKELRQRSDIPVLMVTAKVDEIDRLLGLELGADDYICKPFSPREVVARLNAVLRRARVSTEQSSADYLNEDHYSFVFAGKEQVLSAVEFQLLQKLVKEPGRIYSRHQLMTAMYNDHRIVNERTIDSHIKKIRKKLSECFPEREFIHSIYGVGYRFEETGNSAN